MWAFKALWDKGLIYEGYRVLPYCWRCETPLSQHRDAHGRRLPRPPGPGAHRVVRARRRPADAILRLDDHAVDAAVQPGPRRRARHRLRDGRRRRRSRYVLAEARAGAYERELGDGHRRRHAARAAELVGRTLRAAVPVLRRPARTRSRSSPPTSSPPRRAPASCTWRPGFGEDDQNVCAAARHRRRRARWTARAASPPRSTPWAGVHVFDANPDVIARPQGRRPRRAPRDLRPHATRTAGAAARRSSTGRCRRGSCR